MAVRVALTAVAVTAAVLAATVVTGALPSQAAPKPTTAQLPAGFEQNSTQAVCALTGSHGAYTELPPAYTTTKYGLVSGDSGSSFEYDGRVWWLFGNSGATTHAPWGSQNASTRWPAVTTPLSDPAALGSDAIATSSESTRPPRPVAPYNDTEMPPNQHCPVLHFLTETAPVAGAYANPSVAPDPLFNQPYPVSLRRGELPEAGISEGHPARMYVVFGTDNPANCATLVNVSGPCPEPANGRPAAVCGGSQKGSRTRSVMAVYDGSAAQFRGLYDLSAPTTRYGPTCTTSPAADSARFVNVQLQNGDDGYVYIWGTEGGANNGRSPVYLARMPTANIATGQGLQYWDSHRAHPAFVAGSQELATPLFTDHPDACVAQLGVQYNRFLREWILLYRCGEAPAPASHPDGIYMRTAKHPWGPWSAATTVFNPKPDPRTRSGYCYFIYSTQTGSYPKCPPGSPNRTLTSAKKPHVGSYYGPYFVPNWTTGQRATASRRASTTIYYTLDTFDPYGQLILRSTVLGAAVAARVTTVTVIANRPSTYSFMLSAPGEASVFSDSGRKLDLRTGIVRFDVTNPGSSILRHSFVLCPTRLTSAQIKRLPDTCKGARGIGTPLLAPGGSGGVVTHDFVTPGTYEYLSAARGPDSGDAFAGMKGELTIS
jgi:Domain of unknown function (DUF4185)